MLAAKVPMVIMTVAQGAQLGRYANLAVITEYPDPIHPVDRQTMANIKNIVKKVKMLQPIPAVIHKILILADDPDSGVEDLVHLVEHDTAITANLLRTCNSAHMGLPIRIESIHQAITMLGLKTVVELIMAQSLGLNLKRAQKGYQLAKGDLWRQSVAAAMIARTLAEKNNLESIPTIYTAALLKDIGKVILHEFVTRELTRIERLVKNNGLSFVEAEKACIGMDHAKLGGVIATQWNFSPRMVHLIEHHHMIGAAARKDPATATLYLADMVAMLVGTGVGVDRLAYHVYEDVFREHYLSREELKALMLQYKGHHASMGKLLLGG
jgi:HD-like signal output (HDOD) protein